MSERDSVNIKQRLIGAIILVSLGVILIPFILNGGPDLKQTISGTNIPTMPDKLDRKLPDFPQSDAMPAPQTISAYPVENINNNLNKSLSRPDEHSSVQTEMASDNGYKIISQPTTDKIAMAYTLQVASFSQRSNVIALRDKLRNAKYKAYIESVNSKKGKIYRLRIGPYLKFEQISAVQKQLEKQFNLHKTVIVQYKT